MPRGATRSEHNEALTLSSTPFQGTWARIFGNKMYLLVVCIKQKAKELPNMNIPL
ncbi:hypothetical protein MTR_2g016410 [Medicago truncatula]|uniref:Uncharacterized protein n=1 Tax=Medicago truncatula TaxID=3880 RepID=A0A072V5I0_MEDTR|nr:hypothetical protein MTR_2g016410 [Medicago truncatula]